MFVSVGHSVQMCFIVSEVSSPQSSHVGVSPLACVSLLPAFFNIERNFSQRQLDEVLGNIYILFVVSDIFSFVLHLIFLSTLLYTFS